MSSYSGLVGVPGPMWSPARRCGSGRMVRDLLAAGLCPCDPTNGDSCRACDGTAAEERGEWLDACAAERNAW